MLQDIEPRKYHVEYTPVKPSADSRVAFISSHRVLLKEQEEVEFPLFRETGLQEDQVRYLFRIDEETFFLASDPDAEEKLQQQGFVYKGMREYRNAGPRWLVFAAATAAQMGEWYYRHRYCGTCGRPMEHSDKERMLYCGHCRSTIYPKICPAVIVGVINGDKILVSGYKDRRSSVALIAGFAETGESIEDTVRREVMEEVGVKVKNLRYYKSQPWTFTDTLLFGFYCDLDGSEELTVDHNELAMARWATREEVPEDPNKISLTREMLDRFKNGEEC